MMKCESERSYSFSGPWRQRLIPPRDLGVSTKNSSKSFSAAAAAAAVLLTAASQIEWKGNCISVFVFNFLWLRFGAKWQIGADVVITRWTKVCSDGEETPNECLSNNAGLLCTLRAAKDAGCLLRQQMTCFSLHTLQHRRDLIASLAKRAGKDSASSSLFNVTSAAERKG